VHIHRPRPARGVYRKDPQMPSIHARRTVAALVAAIAAMAVLPVAAPAAHHGPTKHHKKDKAKHKKKVATIHVHVDLGANAGGRGGDPGDDYPARWRNAPQDSMFDNWREYNRECTSFAAWALASRNGFNMPFNDNAINWGTRARALGYRVDGNPAVGSIAWSNAGRWGHVAYVVDVSGANVSIEEYNHLGNGTYTARTVPASTFTGYIHFADVTPPAPAPPPVVPAPPATTGPIQGGSATPIQGGGTAPIQGGTTAPIQGGSTPVQGESGGSGSSAPPPPPPVWSEQEGHLGVNTFTNPYNASGMGPRIGAAQTVEVNCRVYAPQIASANPDGWWYRIHTGPWNDAYYSPANTFMNGDPWNGPYTHNTDFAVRVC
jgi:surface antigen